MTPAVMLRDVAPEAAVQAAEAAFGSMLANRRAGLPDPRYIRPDELEGVRVVHEDSLRVWFYLADACQDWTRPIFESVHERLDEPARSLFPGKIVGITKPNPRHPQCTLLEPGDKIGWHVDSLGRGAFAINWYCGTWTGGELAIANRVGEKPKLVQDATIVPARRNSVVLFLPEPHHHAVLPIRSGARFLMSWVGVAREPRWKGLIRWLGAADPGA